MSANHSPKRSRKSSPSQSHQSVNKSKKSPTKLSVNETPNVLTVEAFEEIPEHDEIILPDEKKDVCEQWCGNEGNTTINDKNRFKAFDITAIRVEPKPVIPNLPCTPGLYVPMPYIFRIPSTSTTHGLIQNQPTRCPPFYIQLDHAIAVIWSLYSPKTTGKPLGINQLQWALGVINTIKGEHGNVNKDMAHCINTISDELIEQYAEMADDVVLLKSRENRKHIFQPLANSSSVRLHEEEIMTCRADIIGECVAMSEDSLNVSSKTRVQAAPFSITYADMALRAPSQAKITAADPFKSIIGEGSNKQILKEFLSDLRKEQMTKIFVEFGRLNSIQKFIDSGAVSPPHMNEDDRQMQALVADKLKNLQF